MESTEEKFLKARLLRHKSSDEAIEEAIPLMENFMEDIEDVLNEQNPSKKREKRAKLRQNKKTLQEAMESLRLYGSFGSAKIRKISRELEKLLSRIHQEIEESGIYKKAFQSSLINIGCSSLDLKSLVAHPHHHQRLSNSQIKEVDEHLETDKRQRKEKGKPYDEHDEAQLCESILPFEAEKSGIMVVGPDGNLGDGQWIYTSSLAAQERENDIQDIADAARLIKEFADIQLSMVERIQNDLDRAEKEIGKAEKEQKKVNVELKKALGKEENNKKREDLNASAPPPDSRGHYRANALTEENTKSEVKEKEKRGAAFGNEREKKKKIRFYQRFFGFCS